PARRAGALAVGEMDKARARRGRPSRLEGAMGDEPSPVAESEAMQLLQEVVRQLAPQGRARLGRLDDDRGDAIAAALVLDDPPRAVCVALAGDPEARAGWRLLGAEANAPRARGPRALDGVVGAAEVDPPPPPVTQRRCLRLRAYNHTTAGTLARTYASLRRRTDVARDAPGAAAAGARAAWTKIREAAASVASYERLHL